MEESEERTCPLITTPCTEIEDGMVDQVQADSVSAAGPFEALSFAPKDFIFQAPSGLPSFKFEPLTPRSADAFLTPRFVHFIFVYLMLKSFFNVISLHMSPIFGS